MLCITYESSILIQVVNGEENYGLRPAGWVGDPEESVIIRRRHRENVNGEGIMNRVCDPEQVYVRRNWRREYSMPTGERIGA